MRPLPQVRRARSPLPVTAVGSRTPLAKIILFSVGAWTLGCAEGGAGSVAPPPPAPPSIQVTITPDTSSVLLGATLPFTANVSNTSDIAVSWSVNGIPGGSPQAGTITTAGVYNAPADLPANASVQITAASRADSSKSASATVTITSDIVVSLSPGNSTVELGAAQGFHATVSSAGRPDTSVRWSVSATSCPTACGTLDANGNYTAPQILPVSPTVTITAASVADPSKQSSSTVSITSNFALALAAPSSLSTSATAALVATLTPLPGSNPNPGLSWSLSGTGCNAVSCGILQVITTQSAGAAKVDDTASYTAPTAAPQPDLVTVTVTSLADPTKKAQASIAIQPGSGLSISPIATELSANHHITLTASGGASAGNLNWSVSGVPGGSASLGQICVVGSSPCQNFSGGPALQVDYVAPGAIPAANPVSVSVATAGNPAFVASSQITILNHVLVSVLPNSVALPPLGVQGFTATVLGTGNQGVVWQVQGSQCGASGACGLITPSGAYTAPAVAPTPNSFQIVATSQDDGSQSGSATVTISSGANILSLHPASVYQGAASGFTLLVDGSGFIASSSVPGSTILIGGNARVTTCATANSCSVPVAPADVLQAGPIAVQIQNPDGTTSNAVSFVVLAPSATEGVLPLSSGAPTNAGNNIVVVEPTSAGLDTPASNLDLDVAAIGSYITATNTCNLAGSAIPIVRPSSGIAAADICLFSQSGFDTSMSYSVSGSGDVSVVAKQPAGLGIIHLTLQIPATAVPGGRTLFIQNDNLDRTAATGVLEIQ
jgi:hypothetical protein